MLDPEQLDYSGLATQDIRRCKAVLYHDVLLFSPTKALRTAGIFPRKPRQQINKYRGMKKVDIFCQKAKTAEKLAPPAENSAASGNIDALSRKGLISQLQQVGGRDHIRAIELIAKMRGFLGTRDTDLDPTRPIYVVTGARPRPRHTIGRDGASPAEKPGGDTPQDTTGEK